MMGDYEGITNILSDVHHAKHNLRILKALTNHLIWCAVVLGMLQAQPTEPHVYTMLLLEDIVV